MFHHRLTTSLAILLTSFVVMVSCDQEKSGGRNPKRNGRWLESSLRRWLSPDRQLFIWPERLPFCPPNSRGAAPFTTKASLLPPPSCIIHPDQSCHFEEMIEDNKLPNFAMNSSIKAGMVQGVEGAESKDAEESTIVITADQVVMDVGIWSSLPEDIIEKVLAWLPLTSVLRFRAVCRRWNSVLLSGSFLSSHSKSSLHRQPCFLLCTIGQFACTYDPSLGKWLTLRKPTSPGASVIASTGSLFCLGNQVTECRVLCVCNPITRSLRYLPAMRKLSLIHKITMFEDPHSNSYTIVVAGEEGLPVPNPHHFNLITEVFDSRSNAWHAAQDPPPDAKFGSDPGVWFEGAFYCITELPYGVVRFFAEDGIWEEVNVAMPKSLSVPSLVTVRNRLMMVGRCKVQQAGQGTVAAATMIRIWELVQRSKEMGKCGDETDDHIQEVQIGGDEDMGILTKGNAALVVCTSGEYEWMEVMEMPRAVSDEFLAPLASYSPFVCAGVGSSIFMTTHLSPRVLVLDLSLMAMAASCPSAAANCWSWLPQDPLFPIHRDFHLLGFLFEPRFDASP